MKRNLLSAIAAAAALAAASWSSAHAARPNIAVQPISRMSEGWWRDRFQQKQRELRPDVQLVWLGDSITQNWEREGPEPWRMFRPVWNRFYGDRHALNLGFKGDSTCHVLWRLEHGELDTIHPRLFITLIGANNFGHIHTDAAQTFAGMQKILGLLHERDPQARVLLLGVLPSIRSAWVDENTRQLNAMLAGYGHDHSDFVTYRDVSGLFMRDGRVDAGRFLDPHLTPPDPPLHPTAEAQAAIAAAIEPDVARILGDHIHR
ncbi:GDSL-type esterase/lipase family protein [Rhizosaccharibacter radicis]|uniref:GDSL-type esterase/lipase family protein n=1 Tax=Rhizosaccharibacter radicis TaxID=2782605 RepID=A0ABT1VZ44_9PROT|nr:GDSL-type esterase/lipase family protein [Acetobacteraceae bacterium KSS12]